jgi:hypothetical protein
LYRRFYQIIRVPAGFSLSVTRTPANLVVIRFVVEPFSVEAVSHVRTRFPVLAEALRAPVAWQTITDDRRMYERVLEPPTAMGDREYDVRLTTIDEEGRNQRTDRKYVIVEWKGKLDNDKGSTSVNIDEMD